MDEVSKKNQDFIIDEVRMLENIDDMEICISQIQDIAAKLMDGNTTLRPQVSKLLENARYIKTIIEDTASSISMYSASVFYEVSDVLNYHHKTRKNVIIKDVSIPRNLEVSEFIDDFSVSAINIGYDGVNPTDLLKAKIYSTDSSAKSEVVIEIQKSVSNINEEFTVVISKLECPSIHSQYSLDIVFETKEGIVMGEKTITGINIFTTMSSEVSNDL